jgi:hypothetical protein
MKCCPIKLLAYQNFPGGKGLEMMQNKLIQLERQIASIQNDIIAETNDSPNLLITRNMRINMFLEQRSDNIFKSIITDTVTIIPDFKAIRLAELNSSLNSLTLERDEVNVLIDNLKLPTKLDKVLTEEEIIAKLNDHLSMSS